MYEPNKNVQNIFWKIGIGIITGILVILFIVFLYSPVHTEYTKTIDGEYVCFKGDNEDEIDKVVIHIDGEMQREHRFSKNDVSFVGDVWVEFEKNPDMNFEMGCDKLDFIRAMNNKNSYTYSVDLNEKMYDCVEAIYWKRDKKGYSIRMSLNSEWESWENWFYQDEDKKEELSEIESTNDGMISAYFE